MPHHELGRLAKACRDRYRDVVPALAGLRWGELAGLQVDDLVIAPGALDSPQLAPLWSLLRSDRFQSAVTVLGGYSAKEMGRRIR